MARLLILEDDLVFGFQLKQDLEAEGHEAEIVSSASDAADELRQMDYDLVITDIIIRRKGKSIPEGGLKLIGWIRQNPAVKTLPIVAITGTSQLPGFESILEMSKRLGANEGLEKPFNMIELLAIIDRLVLNYRRSS